MMVCMFASTGEMELAVLGLTRLLAAKKEPRGGNSSLLLGTNSCSRTVPNRSVASLARWDIYPSCVGVDRRK
jgi:hypothetical protein